jgi:hypothetical protein
MIGLLVQVLQSSSYVGLAEAETSGAGLPPGAIGYVVLGLIVIPVVVLVASAIFGSPRNTRVPGLFLICMGLLVSATVVGFAAFGALLGLVFPK